MRRSLQSLAILTGAVVTLTANAAAGVPMAGKYVRPNASMSIDVQRIHGDTVYAIVDTAAIGSRPLMAVGSVQAGYGSLWLYGSAPDTPGALALRGRMDLVVEACTISASLFKLAEPGPAVRLPRVGVTEGIITQAKDSGSGNGDVGTNAREEGTGKSASDPGSGGGDVSTDAQEQGTGKADTDDGGVSTDARGNGTGKSDTGDGGVSTDARGEGTGKAGTDDGGVSTDGQDGGTGKSATDPDGGGGVSTDAREGGTGKAATGSDSALTYVTSAVFQRQTGRCSKARR